MMRLSATPRVTGAIGDRILCAVLAFLFFHITGNGSSRKSTCALILLCVGKGRVGFVMLSQQQQETVMDPSSVCRLFFRLRGLLLLSTPSLVAVVSILSVIFLQSSTHSFTTLFQSQSLRALLLGLIVGASSSGGAWIYRPSLSLHSWKTISVISCASYKRECTHTHIYRKYSNASVRVHQLDWTGDKTTTKRAPSRRRRQRRLVRIVCRLEKTSQPQRLALHIDEQE